MSSLRDRLAQIAFSLGFTAVVTAVLILTTRPRPPVAPPPGRPPL